MPYTQTYPQLPVVVIHEIGGALHTSFSKLHN